MFSPALHLTRANALFGTDLDGQCYARLDLPSAKTAKAGEIQHIFLVKQDSLCPIDALHHLSDIVPAGTSDPLFSWRDNRGNIRPMVRDTALKFLNERFTQLGFGTMFGHSFRIGGASFLLSQGVDPEVRLGAGVGGSTSTASVPPALSPTSRILSSLTSGTTKLDSSRGRLNPRSRRRTSN
ncbi:hypothetical protein C8T65DRAFT_751469 [Cerioporus squamosus]|nr:hypothetical protein C8T65DRAFT_751469 [Cerioporus squamosus]